MRAGRYAVVAGRTFPASFSDNSEVVAVHSPEGPETADLAWEPQPGRGWRAVIPRSGAERLFEVVTWGLVQEVYPVNVWQWVDPDKVVVRYLAGPGYPEKEYASVPVPKNDDGTFREPPGFRPMEQPGSPLIATVAVSSLTHVVEREHDLPLEAGSRAQQVWAAQGRRQGSGRRRKA